MLPFPFFFIFLERQTETGISHLLVHSPKSLQQIGLGLAETRRLNSIQVSCVTGSLVYLSHLLPPRVCHHQEARPEVEPALRYGLQHPQRQGLTTSIPYFVSKGGASPGGLQQLPGGQQ